MTADRYMCKKGVKFDIMHKLGKRKFVGMNKLSNCLNIGLDILICINNYAQPGCEQGAKCNESAVLFIHNTNKLQKGMIENQSKACTLF